MKIKKDLIIVVLATFCLTSVLFLIPASSSGILPYHPWWDVNDDGKIDIQDLARVSGAFGTYGEPINKTALLLELISRVDSLNASLLDLEAYFETRIDTLNVTIVEQQSRIAELESEIAVLNATKLGTPDYDSGWFDISNGGQVIKTHNLSTTNVLVFMVGKYSNSSSPYIHQRFYGGEETWPNYWGAYWLDLTETTIRVVRQAQDVLWNNVRVMIWKIPEP